MKSRHKNFLSGHNFDIIIKLHLHSVQTFIFGPGIKQTLHKYLLREGEREGSIFLYHTPALYTVTFNNGLHYVRCLAASSFASQHWASSPPASSTSQFPTQPGTSTKVLTNALVCTDWKKFLIHFLPCPYPPP